MKISTFTANYHAVPAGERYCDQPRTWLREVEIGPVSLAAHEIKLPDDDTIKGTALDGTTESHLLDLIFEMGQNDFQPCEAPSLSVGDLIILDDANGRRAFRIEPIGFKQMDLYEDLVEAERLAIIAATSDAAGLLGYQAAVLNRAERKRAGENG